MTATAGLPPIRGLSRAQSAPGQATVALPRRRRSSLTRRILTLNVLALAIPVAGLLYLDEYRSGLVQQQLDLMRTEAELISGALATSGVVTGPEGDDRLLPETTGSTMRRLVDVSKTRARLFDASGILIADSSRQMGPGGPVEIEMLPPPESNSLFTTLVRRSYDWVVALLPRGKPLPVYRERALQVAGDYPENLQALTGDAASALRVDNGGTLMLSVAVPVQRYRQVLGALMLSADGAGIDDAVRDVRLDILKVFGGALAVTVLLSFYLAGTIARPVHRLAEAAEGVRRGQGRQTEIPDFTARRDEIGDLSGVLREMTEALWTRMDAIEHFAADVAHEIKNPLSSLRSAVETVARIEDPERQRRLMAIILDDVHRLDRLISDISDASRVDAEMSRARKEPVDVGRMLAMLAELHEATAKPEEPRLILDLPQSQSLIVPAIEGRLVQVLRNLIANAISFSPPDGDIMLAARRDGRSLRISVSDQGPGIPPGKLTAIFDRFYSERPAGEKFGTHSGLGLSISRQILEAHGGQIYAENLSDGAGNIEGARFTLLLPLA
ncbi:MAG: two-component system, OmpR family, sensor histidine kinase ChvG [Rhodospirillaceae bacterium]|nr:two-component system, OmpR family, sensor histidine kinase ChvG [Rhodospirillaceae bacterium]